jgi:hypothetical protein
VSGETLVDVSQWLTDVAEVIYLTRLSARSAAATS